MQWSWSLSVLYPLMVLNKVPINFSKLLVVNVGEGTAAAALSVASRRGCVSRYRLPDLARRLVLGQVTWSARRMALSGARSALHFNRTFPALLREKCCSSPACNPKYPPDSSSDALSGIQGLRVQASLSGTSLRWTLTEPTTSEF